MEPARFSLRLNAFEKGERSWSADAQGFTETWPGGESRRFDWSTLESVVLGYAPSRFKPDRYSARLVFRAQGRREEVVVENMHFAGVGRFEARSEAYAVFMRQTLAFARASKPDAQYSGGTGVVSYGLQTGLAAVSLLGIGYVLILFGLGGLIIWLRLVLIAVLTVFVIRWAIRARPARLNPEAIDPRFLPPDPSLPPAPGG
ncbi:MAG: hypothetical protein ACQRW7_00220 [Caulobacterales bacterium]|uniref:hypothetical protein n=1 Tax=Glycocaulis sp. TaxID=1969725 RepID=UPI003FA17E49